MLIQRVTAFVLHFFYAHEYLALVSLLFLEEDGVPLPLPGETWVALAATRESPSVLYGLSVVLAAVIGASLGASGLYLIMRHGGRRVLLRYGHFILLNPTRIDNIEQWFHRRGPIAIFAGWFIPGFRIPTIAVAGLANTPYSRFIRTILLASTLWATLYYIAGAVFYSHSREVQRFLASLAPRLSLGLVFGIGGAILLAVIIAHAWYRAHPKTHPTVLEP